LQLFLSDLDFTLLRSDTTISNFTKEIWNRANSKAKLSIATARSFTGVSKLLKKLELKEPMILLDGSIIARADGEILHMAYINKNLGSEIVELARKEFNIEPLIVAHEGGVEKFFYPKYLNSYQEELIKSIQIDQRVFARNEFWAKEYNLKIVYQANKEIGENLESLLKSIFGNNIEIKLSNDPYYNCYFITILNPKGDKAYALQKLEEIENIDIKDTTVFGDSHNDIGLFEIAGVKVAVANAIEELKQRADIILPHSNEEDAVAKYLQKSINL